MGSDQVLLTSLRFRDLFCPLRFVFTHGAPLLRVPASLAVLRGSDGSSLDSYHPNYANQNYACHAFSTGHVTRFLMAFSRTDSEVLEEYTLTTSQLKAIGKHPGTYFQSLARELETYKALTTEIVSDNLLVVTISLEFVEGYPQNLQRSFRGIFRTANSPF